MHPLAVLPRVSHLRQAVDCLPQEAQIRGESGQAAPQADIARCQVHSNHVEVQGLARVVASFMQQPQCVVGVWQVGCQLYDFQQQLYGLLIPAPMMQGAIEK